ncbi:hypothetical protein HanRHA438_Chr09g0379771 [Helianthus annuus]|nr:hypothetical protein HanRHA438_Chr09g0379771 [Helianthus annuus]
MNVNRVRFKCKLKIVISREKKYERGRKHIYPFRVMPAKLATSVSAAFHLPTSSIVQFDPFIEEHSLCLTSVGSTR